MVQRVRGSSSARGGLHLRTTVTSGPVFMASIVGALVCELENVYVCLFFVKLCLRGDKAQHVVVALSTV